MNNTKIRRKTMTRGVSQALYKYLPECWIDFTVRGEERNNYIAFVDHWNSEKIDGINNRRLLRVVNNSIMSFMKVGGTGGERESASGYGNGLSVDNCDVLTPKNGGDERGIVARISPLTFFCPGCHRVYKFTSEDAYRSNRKCFDCKIELKQFRLIYYCKCGFATDKHPVYCRKCKSIEGITWSGRLNDYEFRCKKCGNKIQMFTKCDGCGARLAPKVALDSSQFFPFTINLIDIINEKVESFIGESEYGSLLTIAYWIGEINKEQLTELIERGTIGSDPEQFKKEYEDNYKTFIDAGLSHSNAEVAAKAAANRKAGSEYIKIANDIRSALFVSEDCLQRTSEAILEYVFVDEIEDCSTLQDAVNISKQLNTNANPERYVGLAKQYGISAAKVCGNVPFICCSYGYTREKPEPADGVVLHAFAEEKHGKKNVYATKMQTEGVLIEFDRRMIVQWLRDNNFVQSIDDELLNDEKALKMWFVNSVRVDTIKPFSDLDDDDRATYYVYRLIHTISHLLIKSAAEMCGLDKNSISEYILPSVPAVLIYCQNSQGFKLGALFNLFEAYFDKWIETAYENATKCIFDPICIDRYKACTGCLYLNEVSCQHFNHDLDRALVIGRYDITTNEKTIGFWEELDGTNVSF